MEFLYGCIMYLFFSLRRQRSEALTPSAATPRATWTSLPDAVGARVEPLRAKVIQRGTQHGTMAPRTASQTPHDVIPAFASCLMPPVLVASAWKRSVQSDSKHGQEHFSQASC